MNCTSKSIEILTGYSEPKSTLQHNEMYNFRGDLTDTAATIDSMLPTHG